MTRIKRQIGTRFHAACITLIRLTLLSLALATGSGSPALAEPNNGGGPRPPIGDGPVITIPNPPGGGPCTAPPLPPGVFQASHARGQIRETCGGVLQPVANKPVQVLLRVTQQPFPCDLNNIQPPFSYIVPIAEGATDANGQFNIEFVAANGNISPDLLLNDLKVRVVVLDSVGGPSIWETAFYTGNAGEDFVVNEDIIYCLTEGTRIHVLGPDGNSAFDAEVFVNGKLHSERTNPNGVVTINPPVPAGSKIVARALVHESRSKRATHAQGSDQNWKYRAYITSIPLKHDADGNNPRFEPTVVNNPNGAFELRLQRTASYIGLHLVASLEWDASPTELGDFATKMQSASDYFYNATDGQMLIERVDVFDDGKVWEESDFKVFADASLRANVDWPGDGFWEADGRCCWQGSWMNMSRSNSHRVYCHEFGHYGMLLGDEYEDDDDTHCAAGVGSGSTDFDAGGGKASCMMFQQSSFTKICSNHPDNPHLTGTEQGDEDCWSEWKRHFTGESAGPGGVPKWRILSPVDRGAIINRLPGIPVSDWSTFVSINDFNNTNLCKPVKFHWLNNGGKALGARIFSKNSSGRTIFQGTTDANGIIKPFSGGTDTVAGLHVGDTIGAMYRVPAGTSFMTMVKKRTYTQSDCVSATVVLAQAPGQPIPTPREQLVELEALPFSMAAQIDPGAALGEAIVRVRAGAVLADAPMVRLSVDSEVDVREVAMSFDAPSGDWIGHVAGLPDHFAVVAEVEATNETGEKATFVMRTTFTGAPGDADVELISTDGDVEIELAADALPMQTQVAIGGSVAPLPEGFPGRILTGPVALSTNGRALARAGTMRFLLPFENEESMLEQIDPSLLIVLAHDEAGANWVEVESKFLHGELAVETELTNLGAFVLLERGTVEVPVEDPDEESGPIVGGDSADDNSDTNSDSESESETPVAPTDIGGGACGGGVALASPLMLAILGTHRRSRSKRRSQTNGTTSGGQ